MDSKVVVILEPREVLGKKVKQLRLAGITPVHLYGSAGAPLALQCQTAILMRVLAQAGRNTPVYVTVEGQERESLAMIRELQWHPVKGDLLHMDLLRVERAVAVQAEVPLVLDGTPPGTRGGKATLVQHVYHLQVEAPPLDIPHELVVDVSSLTEPDMVIRAGDIKLPSNVNLLADTEVPVARLEAIREAVSEAATSDQETAGSTEEEG